jgi:hypothetical protein
VTRGAAGSEPAGYTADCFYVLGMHAGAEGITVPDLTDAIAYENGSDPLFPVLTRRQVTIGLHGLARRRGGPLAEQYTRGRWRMTPHGHRMLAVWCGDDEPLEIPCGLGWPELEVTW